jgi:hypothetical protein
MLKNITLSADKTLIEQARQRAEAENTTLNAEFRRWLSKYARDAQPAPDLAELMARLSYAEPGKSFSREEMNAR